MIGRYVEYADSEDLKSNSILIETLKEVKCKKQKHSTKLKRLAKRLEVLGSTIRPRPKY